MPIPSRATTRSSRLCVAVAAALSFSSPILAKTPEADADTPTFGTVVVTADAPVSPLTWRTDPALPRQPVPASDGADYLKTIPGFTALRNGGSNGDPVLRGMFGSRLNLLANDGSMPGACPARMDNPLSYVSPETYDRLVVVKGPQTVLWGPGASAGTVRFERRVDRFDAPGLRLSGSVLGGAHGRNDQVADLAAGAAAGYLRASGNRSASGDYHDGHGRRVPSAWKKWNADLAMGWTPDDDTVLELSAGSGDGEARYAGRGMDGSRFRRDSRGLRFGTSNLGGALSSLQASLYRNHADHVMDNYSLREPNPDGPMSMPMAANVDRRTTGGRVALSWTLPRWTLVAGADAQDSRHRARSATGRDAWRAQPWATDATFGTQGLFGEATLALSGRARWVGGVRIDRADATDARATAGRMDQANPTAGTTRRETLPAGFLRFERSLAQTPLHWYAGVGRTRRMPDYWELFSADMGPAGAPNAFAGVAPERTTQLDAGLQFRGARIDAWVSAYVGRIDDYILFSYVPGGMMGTLATVTNVDARIHGAEAGIEVRPAPAWRLGGSLAWAWGANRDSGRALPQMPPLDARFSAGYERARWNLGVLVRAVRAQDRIAPGQGNVVGRDLGRSAGFATLAMHGGVRLGERAMLTAGVDNVLDRDYGEHLNLASSADFGYPADPVRIHEPGRSAWLKLNFDY